MLTDNHNCFLC